MALTTTRLNSESTHRYSRVVRSGTRTAGDFSVVLGFTPYKVLVTNLTDGVSALWDSFSGNAKQSVQAAAGDRTYEDGGVSVADRTVSVTVATKGLETDNDVVMIEAWG